MRKSLTQLLKFCLCCSTVVLCFSGSEKAYAKPDRAGSYGRCTDAGQILSAALAGETHRTDTLLRSAPEHPQEVTNSRPPNLVRLTGTSYVWTTRWIGDQPSRDLVRRWLAAPYVSISKCFGKAGSQRRIGDLPGFANFRPITNDKAPPFVVLATAPVFDKDGAYALVYYSTAVRDFAFGGRSVFTLLKKSGSGWTRVGSRILAVS